MTRYSLVPHLQSTPTLETIFAHFSVRHFKPQTLNPELLKVIVEAGTRASTYANIQATSVIRISDPQLRQEIEARCFKQKAITQAAEFLIICFDFNRFKVANSQAQLQYSEVFLAGTIDASIFAQNMMLAAESLGLGGLFIGAIRHEIAWLDQQLALPEYVVPIFGLCLGYPDEEPLQRPRFALEQILHTNSYTPISPEQLQAYDQTLHTYNQKYLHKDGEWSNSTAHLFDRPANPEFVSYLTSKGFCKK
ncbi:oxygen-insensitive NADPH nitroreductase [Psittacicella gerlachiana]|uniref:Nitroreductase A n=1 Tax=Psittacicella gerlachiana TaxID=2028574 RepID=A0A3A1YF97_9GAMM|nr:oxygen-insensitive NADPH nitroreductase [Psittacicella gerlachiana]RIY35848.1 nitroreductase A [Psittacicella gerlachiana]